MFSLHCFLTSVVDQINGYKYLLCLLFLLNCLTGEQHGFRKAENVQYALDGEFYFFSKVLGYEAADTHINVCINIFLFIIPSQSMFVGGGVFCFHIVCPSFWLFVHPSIHDALVIPWCLENAVIEIHQIFQTLILIRCSFKIEK